MKAGYAYVDITPPLGCTLNGFIARYRPAQAVDLPLYARALWLCDDHAPALLVAFDALGLTDSFAERLIADLAAATGSPVDAVILHASHTHAGGMTVPLRGIGPADPAYLARLRSAALAAAAEAKQAACPVGLSWSTAPVQIGVNRRQRLPDGSTIIGRNPAGPCDKQVRVLQFAGPRARILLFDHACHPLCIGPQDSAISPDFFGHAAAALRAEGYQAIYLNGCAGDINPQRAGESLAAAKEEGQRLAAAVLDSLKTPQTVPAPALAAHSKRLALPYQELPPLHQLQAALQQPDKTVRAQDRCQAVVRDRIQSAWRQWLDDLRHETEGGRALPPAMARASTLRLGPLALVALPGEVFFETGQTIAAQMAAPLTIVAAYCFAYIGYVCPPQAYDEGGYEPDDSHRFVSFWKLSRHAADTLASTALSLWHHH